MLLHRVPKHLPHQQLLPEDTGRSKTSLQANNGCGQPGTATCDMLIALFTVLTKFPLDHRSTRLPTLFIAACLVSGCALFAGAVRVHHDM